MLGYHFIQRGLGSQWEVRKDGYGNSTVIEICATKRKAVSLANKLNRR